jgi:hypothetical protein
LVVLLRHCQIPTQPSLQIQSCRMNLKIRMYRWQQRQSL